MNKEVNKKEEKKAFIKWLLIVIVAFLAGTFGGSLLSANPHWVDRLLEIIASGKDMVTIPVLIFSVIVTVVGYVYCFVKYKKAKAMVDAGYDDETYEIAEEQMGRISVVVSVLSGLNFLFFGVSEYACGMAEKNPTLEQALLSIVPIMLMIAASTCNVVMQSKTIALDKQMNPEKKGNVFDKKFAKDYLESCDEAEKSLIYESAYSAYRIAISLCTVMWAVAFIGMLSFHTGVLAVILVSIIMIAMTTTYALTAYKLQYKK